MLRLLSGQAPPAGLANHHFFRFFSLSNNCPCAAVPPWPAHRAPIIAWLSPFILLFIVLPGLPYMSLDFFAGAGVSGYVGQVFASTMLGITRWGFMTNFYFLIKVCEAVRPWALQSEGKGRLHIPARLVGRHTQTFSQKAHGTNKM